MPPAFVLSQDQTLKFDLELKILIKKSCHRIAQYTDEINKLIFKNGKLREIHRRNLMINYITVHKSLPNI